MREQTDTAEVEKICLQQLEFSRSFLPGHIVVFIIIVITTCSITFCLQQCVGTNVYASK